MKKWFTFGCLSLFLLLALFRFLQIKTRRNQESRFERLVKQLDSQIKNPPVRSEPLKAGTHDRAQMFEVRSAYDQLNLNGDIGSRQIFNLSTISEGLCAKNSIVRATTDDIVRHILTSYVRHHRRGNWHKNRIVDEFFKLYKKNPGADLAHFLRVFPNSPEAEYLNEI